VGSDDAVAIKIKEDHMRTNDVQLARPIGLAAGIALVIGGVIGMGIYALIAAVGAQAGSSLWLAFILAIIVSAVGVAPLIQVASAMPRAGGGFLYTSRLLNPFMGAMASNLALLGAGSSTAMVSMGLAGYIAPYLPFDVSPRILAIILPLLFCVLYLFGLRLAAWLQMFLAAQLIIALLVYGLSGAFSNEIHFALSFPQGAGGFIMAIILCYSVCMGFQVIAEMGEEMKDARRNIPLSLLFGGAIILIIYIIVGMVFINSLDYDFEKIKAMTAPLIETGRLFLPAFWVFFLGIGALSAGLTSFNAGAIALPRELFSQARDGIMPAFLARIDRRTRSPLNAVFTYFAFVVLLLLSGQSIDFYGVMTAVGILAMTAILSIAAVRMPARFPERYQKAYFKISKPWLIILVAVSVASSLGFILLVLMELPVVGGIYLAWIVLTVVYYFLRVSWLKKTDDTWEARMQQLSGSDEH
jgi:APA family basic amino acid/polyamine antiporter